MNGLARVGGKDVEVIHAGPERPGMVKNIPGPNETAGLKMGADARR